MNTSAEKSSSRLRAMTLTAMFAAILCIVCPISIPITGLVPITFSLLAIYLAGGLLGSGCGTLAVLIYLALGAAGLPVFSKFSGGVAALIGPTGGYLIGYIPCVAITGISRRHPRLFPLLSAAGLAVCYLFGTIWLSISTGNPFGAALKVAVLPFLPFDAIKIVMASLLFYPLRSGFTRIARK